ncbi:hypothetical protein GCM10009558_016100 [Virgisporangium aurantiacum]
MPEPLRIALLSYRSKPYCGGQGVYVHYLSRELVRLGHQVEVFSGPPLPHPLDAAVKLTEVRSLDLYREPDPFRVPRLHEFTSATDWLEWLTMCTGAFPEPLTFSLRVSKLLRRRRNEFDIVHDNQGLGYGLLGLQRSMKVVATVHHPITVDREIELAAAPNRRRRAALRRWYGFTRMQGRVVRRLPAVCTVSESSEAETLRAFKVRPERLSVIGVGVDDEVFRPPTVPRSKNRIVTVTSADVPLKGLDDLLHAVAKLRTERDIELVVVGTPKPDGPADRTVTRLGAERSPQEHLPVARAVHPDGVDLRDGGNLGVAGCPESARDNGDQYQRLHDPPPTHTRIRPRLGSAASRGLTADPRHLSELPFDIDPRNAQSSRLSR